MSDIQKMMPQNLEAEQRTLGAMLLDDEAIIRTTEIISARAFYSDKHLKIYNAIYDCYQLEGTTDIVTVSERLRFKNELESIGGAAYLAYLTSATATSANIKVDARRVAKEYLYRRVILWTNEIKDQAHNGVEDLREWFGKMQFGFLSLSEAIKEKRSPRIVDVLSDLKEQWKEFKEAKDEKSEQKNSGKYCEVDLIKKFNEESAIPYFMPGHLWMVGGYTSVGKSTFLSQLLCDACGRNAKALIFSLEEGRTTKAVKMIANLTNIPQRYLLTGELSDDSFTLVQVAEEKLKSWDLLVYDDVRTLEEICLKIKKHVLQGHVDIVAIDYVQNIQGNGNSIYNDMRLVGPTLLDIAVDLGITIVALSQVTNESMRDASQLIGLKGAGELAAAADIVLWLKRIKGDDRALDCEIRKNRPFGHTGIIPLTFSDRYTRMLRRSW